MRKVRLEDIFEFIRNGAQIKQFDGAGIPITRIETISNLKIDTNRLGYADIFNDDYQEYYLQNGDLLMSHINSPAHLGKTAIVEQLNKKIIHGMNLLCLRANHQVIPKYIFYYFQTQPFKNALTKIMKKSVNQASISVSDLKKIEITIPSYSEQSNSVAILEQLDYQISLRQQQLQTLAHLVKSRFYEMFGDIFNTKFSMFKLEELCEFIKDGTHQTPKYTDDKINGFKFLSSKDVTSGKISWESIKYIPEDLHNELYSKIAPKRNDILLAKNGTTGVAALVDCDDIFDIYVSLAILRFHEGNNPKYLLYAINSDGTKWQFNSSLKGVGVPNLHLGEIRKTKIPLPPLALQNQFADFVAEVDKSQLAGQKSLDELETLKKSLMQAYFG